MNGQHGFQAGVEDDAAIATGTTTLEQPHGSGAKRSSGRKGRHLRTGLERMRRKPTAAVHVAAGDASTSQMQITRLEAKLCELIGSADYARYFESGTRMAIAEGVLEVLVPDAFCKGAVIRRYLDTIRAIAVDHLHAAHDVRVRVEAAASVCTPAQEPARADKALAPTSKRQRLHGDPRARGRNPRFSLDTFVVGASNRLAHSAAVRIGMGDGDRAFSPLFVHGGSGLGKTHLLQGAASLFEQQHPGARVRCVTAEAFTNEYLTALRTNTMDKFRKSYRGLDMLCVDDVHFFASKEATQNEVLHTFDSIDLEGAVVILASDEHPRHIRKLSSALVSRFMSGAVVRLDAPEPALRVRLVDELATRRDLPLEPEAARLIADRAGRPSDAAASVRDIEGMLTQVQAVATLLPEVLEGRHRVGVVAVRRALGLSECGELGSCGRGSRDAARPVRGDAVLAEVCRVLRVDVSEVLGKGRHKRIVLARRLTTHLCREMTSMSFPEIAKLLCRPSHSTVVTANKAIQKQLELDERVAISPDLDGVTVPELAAELRQTIASA
ncbi:MAG: DnaA/Hda family protein [Planctomycetota bacterium]